MLTGAIIGLGNVALNGHLPAWQTQTTSKIVAGIDPFAVQREQFGKLMPHCPSFASLEEARGLTLDFVDICTPPHLHLPAILQALKNNLHVLCEKPLALNSHELAQVQQSAQASGKIIFTVHNWKFAPICLKISELLAQNAIGAIQHCAWSVLRTQPSITTDPNNWRLDPQKAGGGILVDHGWHAFYLVLGWLKLQPRTVRAELDKRQYPDLPVEDTAKINIEFEPVNGRAPTAEILLTWASRLRKNWGFLEGSEGSILMDDQTLTLSRKSQPDQVFKFDQALSQGSHHPEWFTQVIAEFLEEINNPVAQGKNLKMAQSCLTLIERAKESNKNILSFRT